MKKLLILMLVLALSSLAGATNLDKVIQLSINGEVAPDEYTMKESDWITLDIMTLDPLGSMELDLEIIPLDGQGHIEIAQGYDTFYDGSDGLGYGYRDIIVAPFDGWSKVVDGVTPTGIGSIVGMTFNPMGFSGTLVDYIMFHCDGLGDVMIQITDAGDNLRPDYSDIDQSLMGSIIIHQIPEPATMLILGLGGLLLRRKK